MGTCDGARSEREGAVSFRRLSLSASSAAEPPRSILATLLQPANNRSLQHPSDSNSTFCVCWVDYNGLCSMKGFSVSQWTTLCSVFWNRRGVERLSPRRSEEALSPASRAVPPGTLQRERDRES